ncbi:hypothetical protein [Flavisolibacter tropicus]|uniref:Uncharacterized protein n=1 Tax=Flavisolibacter tropicus TaxID=1492898 RepID=A0A172TRW3_9BACT|nr:hypothetical protein [Flavisolibacter tropicus]ANE49746.1 hypothetical protein SY85_03810 [Flavisolibacter tropicus]
MHPLHIRIISLLAFVSFFFASCRKEDPIVTPSPQPPSQPSTKSNLYQFVIANLPRESSTGSSSLYAQVMIVNEQNQTVLDNVKLPLQFEGNYKTSSLELPDGKYRVVKFLVNNNVHKTLFVAPVIGSEKALLVAKPLHISYSLPQTALVPVQVEVLKREIGDKPESFGYPSWAFDPVDGPTPPDQGNPFFKIKLRAYAQIGDIYYDSIPATVKLTILNNYGPVTQKTLDLTAGTNEIEIPKAAHSYTFEFSKWGINSTMVLNHEQVREGEVYGIGGKMAPKKIKQEMVYRLVNGLYVPERKVEYNFYSDGHLHRIDYYDRQDNGQPQLVRYEFFAYNTDNKITRIVQYSPKDVFLVNTEFLYDIMKRPYAIEHTENGVVTNAFVTYYQTPGRNNAHIKYSYSHNSNTMDYNQIYEKGNLVESSVAANQSGQKGLYQYDFNINPYIFIGRPDLYLSNQSKNNLVSQQQQYTGSYPNAYPYQSDYTYDNNGYPKEVITVYLSPATNSHSYTLKTVYTYF